MNGEKSDGKGPPKGKTFPDVEETTNDERTIINTQLTIDRDPRRMLNGRFKDTPSPAGCLIFEEAVGHLQVPRTSIGLQEGITSPLIFAARGRPAVRAD